MFAERRKMNKKKILLISIALALILFMVSTYMQKKLTDITPKVEVLYCIKDVEQGQDLKRTDFIPVKIDAAKYSSDLIKSYDEIKNKVAIQNVYPDEPLNKKRIADKNDDTKLVIEPDQRKFSIPMQFIDDPFCGTLRNSDIVDIVHTDTPTAQNPYPSTKVVMQQAKVIGAIDSSGKLIEPTNKSVLATAILFEGTPEQGAEIINGKYTGKYTVMQDPVNANKFEPFTVNGMDDTFGTVKGAKQNQNENNLYR